jgi:asparagine N-glycosylation enzyme membrane subunit Stt3
MCLAIGTSSEARRSWLGRQWWRLARSPGRLLTSGAILQLGASLALLSAGAYGPGHLVGLLGAALLASAGVLFELLPEWSGRGPAHYLEYGTVFYLTALGLVLTDVGLLRGGAWCLWGGVTVGLAWLVAIRALRRYRLWAYSRYEPRARAALAGVYFLGAGLALTVAGL